jgi:hypothetical protein
MSVFIYVDSYFAVDLDKRRSLTGYVFAVGICVVSWKVTLQPDVDQSTTKAKYMAIAKGCKETALVHGELKDEIYMDQL